MFDQIIQDEQHNKKLLPYKRADLQATKNITSHHPKPTLHPIHLTQNSHPDPTPQKQHPHPTQQNNPHHPQTNQQNPKQQHQFKQQQYRQIATHKHCRICLDYDLMTNLMQVCRCEELVHRECMVLYVLGRVRRARLLFNGKIGVKRILNNMSCELCCTKFRASRHTQYKITCRKPTAPSNHPTHPTHPNHPNPTTATPQQPPTHKPNTNQLCCNLILSLLLLFFVVMLILFDQFRVVLWVFVLGGLVGVLGGWAWGVWVCFVTVRRVYVYEVGCYDGGEGVGGGRSGQQSLGDNSCIRESNTKQRVMKGQNKRKQKRKK